MLGKDKLIYDATTPADGDSVAAFLRTGTAALTSTGTALDVNIASSSGLGIEDSAHASGDLGQQVLAVRNDAGTTLAGTDGDYAPLSLDASGRLWTRGMDEGTVADDAADSGNPLKIGTRAVSGALAAISATGDRADSISDLYRRLWVNTAPNVGGSNAAVSVDTTAGGVALFASPLAGRRLVEVQNLGNKAIFVGFGTVTSDNGTRIAAGATMHQELGPDLALKAIAESGTQDVRVLQLA